MNPDIAYKSREELAAFQLEQLKKQLHYVREHSPYYKESLASFDPDDLQHLSDLQHWPLTTKRQLQQKNMDFLCVEREKVIDYITTSGTTGDPLTFAATEGDLQRLADNEHASFLCAGGSPADIYQLMLTLDRRFMAGMAYFLGLRQLGAGIVRVGPGNVLLQFDTIMRTSPTVLVTVPSFLLKLIEHAEKEGINLAKTSVRSAVCIGEPIRDPEFRLNKLGRRIKEKWDLKLYSTYASTEMGAAFTECEAGRGGHLNPAMVAVEFLDEKQKPVAEGELGEVCITSLGVEGMPLVRFLTGDICRHHVESCSCGRNTLRLGPIVGRKNQMIKYKGTTLFPTAFYEILSASTEVDSYIVVVSTNSIDTDDIEVLISSPQASPELEKRIKDQCRARLRVAPSIRFLPSKELKLMQYPDLKRKPVTFIDRRKAK